MDETQKSVISQTKQKTAEYLAKMDIPMALLLLMAMTIIFVSYLIAGNIAFSVVFGIFVVLNLWSLITKITIKKQKPQEKPSEDQALGTPPYIA